jgi:hypothetical protein
MKVIVESAAAFPGYCSADSGLTFAGYFAELSLRRDSLELIRSTFSCPRAYQPVVLVPILRRTFDGRLNVVAGT